MVNHSRVLILPISKKDYLEIFQTEAGAEHAKHTVEKAHQLGLS